MKKYEAGDVRTVALIGHGKSGKTSLGEGFLFDAKVTTRLGKVDEETSNLDTEPEEIQRKSSMQLALGYCEWKKRKINFVDTPGDANFAADAQLGLLAADAAIVVVSAPDGVQVGTERSWALAKERDLPAAVFINKLDRERSNFEQALDEVKQALSEKAVALQLPIGNEQTFSGVVDLLRLKALTFEGDGKTVSEGDIPADMQDAASTAREQLIEAIASTDDELIEKYLETGELSEEEINRGLASGLASGSFVPVLCGSASRNLGVQPLLDFIADVFPSPLARPPLQGKAPDGADVERKAAADGPVAAYVFKTIGTDLGRVALIRVVSGTLTADMTLDNTSKGGKERVGHIYALCGKKRETVEQAAVGDLIGLAKLKDTHTGDTLCDDKEPIVLAQPELPEPVITFALRPKAKGDEEKVASKLHDMTAEDTSLRLERDPSSQELLLRGMGQVHIEMAVDKLKRLGVEVELAEPKVAYRETIKGKATDVEGKHKKQSGGRGQFGVCFIDMEPKPHDKEAEEPLEFVDKIFGGAIPRQFIPSVEKGIRDRMSRGVIAGFPVVDIRVTLKDGKYHPVDSDGRSFEMAGSKGFQEAFKRANPVLLEPVMELEVICPDENMGDIIGDISSRRGKVLGTESRGRNTVVKAQVPQNEVLRYAIDLESITAGRGHFSLAFSHYGELPPNLAEKVIAEAKVHEDED
jgi:elongation factor G